MLRRLFTFASAVSLVLCVVTCVLWVRSCRPGDRDRVSFVWAGDRYTLRADPGMVALRSPPPPPPTGTAADAGRCSAAWSTSCRLPRWC